MNDQLDIFTPAGLVQRIAAGLTYEEPKDVDALLEFRDGIQAEFPQYGWSVHRQLYKHWWYRDFHRQHCQTCLGGGPCELDAIYTRSLNHALKLISERTA